MNKYSHLFFIFIFIFLISIFHIFETDTLTQEVTLNYHTIKPNFHQDKSWEVKSVIEYGDHSVIGVHFPVFKVEPIDSIIQDSIQSEILKFKLLVQDFIPENKNYKSELNIDFKYYPFSDSIISFEFIVAETMSYYAQPSIRTITKTYDFNREKLIRLEDIMEGNYLYMISEYMQDYFNRSRNYKKFTDTKLFHSNIGSKVNKDPNFILEEEKITFIFQKYELFPGYLGSPRIGISYMDLNDYLNSYFISQLPISTISSDKNEATPTMKEVSTPNYTDISKLDPTKPMVALTFDDGPNRNTTIPILDTLKEYGGVATFFVLGNRVVNNGDVLKRMMDEGSEIGNHSFNHKQLTTITSSEIKEQITKTQDAIIEVVGTEPKLMRPTYGSYDKDLQSQIEMPMILWSIDTLDWKTRNAEKISTHVLTNVKDGDIVLMHDIYGSTADAVKTIVPELINQGYQLVTVSQLYEVRGQTLEAGNIYNRSYKE